MKYIRYLFLACLGVALIAVALANRNMVSLKLMPDGLSRIVGMNQTIDLPLFVVIFGGVVAGLLIGFVWEWLREHKHRAEARSERAQKERLQKELSKTRAASDQDEVLALLEQAS